MSDLIDRQAAIDAIRSMQTYKLFAGDDLLLVDQAGAQTELMLLPSAHQEIIRCKDCKHYHENIFGSEIGIGRPYDVLIVGHHGCDFWKGKDGEKDYHFVDREGFCSWAERGNDG